MTASNNNIKLYKEIKRHSAFVLVSKWFCIIVVVLLSFEVFGAFSKIQGETIKFNSKKGDGSSDEALIKNMTRPRLNIEYSNQEYYKMVADKAMQGEGDDIILKNVDAKSSIGDLRAGKLTIKNESSEFYFEDNPSLVIYPNN